MIQSDLLEILRCPVCVHDKEKGGVLIVEHDCWLVCSSCSRKYPIIDNIPVMLVNEGEKWASTPVTELPVPPPAME